MNPLTNVRNIAKLNDQELSHGIFDQKHSWHNQYKDSAYVFIGGLPYELTEGDILCVFSQYGEIVNVNLVRDKKTGKSKGYGFLAYENQLSTILAVDNLNSFKIGGRTIRVDHVEEYRTPKSDEKDEFGNRKDLIEEGCAPKLIVPQENDESLLPLSQIEERKLKKQKKKEKKEKKMKKKLKKMKCETNDVSSGDKSNEISESTSNEKTFSRQLDRGITVKKEPNLESHKTKSKTDNGDQSNRNKHSDVPRGYNRSQAHKRHHSSSDSDEDPLKEIRRQSKKSDSREVDYISRHTHKDDESRNNSHRKADSSNKRSHDSKRVYERDNSHSKRPTKGGSSDCPDKRDLSIEAKELSGTDGRGPRGKELSKQRHDSSETDSNDEEDPLKLMKKMENTSNENSKGANRRNLSENSSANRQKKKDAKITRDTSDSETDCDRRKNRDNEQKPRRDHQSSSKSKRKQKKHATSSSESDSDSD